MSGSSLHMNIAGLQIWQPLLAEEGATMAEGLSLLETTWAPEQDLRVGGGSYDINQLFRAKRQHCLFIYTYSCLICLFHCNKFKHRLHTQPCMELSCQRFPGAMLQLRKEEADVICYSAAISALEKGQQGHLAIDSLPSHQIRPEDVRILPPFYGPFVLYRAPFLFKCSPCSFCTHWGPSTDGDRGTLG